MLTHHLPPSPDIKFEGAHGLASANGSFLDLFSDDPLDTTIRFDPGGAMDAYGSWLGDLFSGELGDTQYSETVVDGVSRTIPLSMQLVLYSQISAGWRARAVDVGVRAVSLVGMSAPVFVIGPVLLILLAVGGLELFGLELGTQMFPAGRYIPIGEGLRGHLMSMTLPSLTLGLSTAAVYLVLLRSGMIQQLTQENAHLARSKGLSPARVVSGHALRPAAPTVVPAIAVHSAIILGNLIIVERIFLLPGFGDYVMIAIEPKGRQVPAPVRRRSQQAPRDHFRCHVHHHVRLLHGP
ncbi:MAG: peptide/nickel transport system permease protein [Candidatus Poriferisodalaceae bacterium]|jgi:peptide/nickel transport system permease protein